MRTWGRHARTCPRGKCWERIGYTRTSWRRCFKDILEAEEDRVETGLARVDIGASGVTVAQRVQGDQDGESSVAGEVLQMHLAVVLSRLFHRNRAVRAAAISLVGVMLRQGLVNPVDVIPQLPALGGDSAGFVRAEAFRPLAVEDSKNGELIRTRLSDGLFMAYTLGSKVPTTRAVCSNGGRSCPAPTPRREARAGVAPSLFPHTCCAFDRRDPAGTRASRQSSFAGGLRAEGAVVHVPLLGGEGGGADLVRVVLQGKLESFVRWSW